MTALGVHERTKTAEQRKVKNDAAHAEPHELEVNELNLPGVRRGLYPEWLICTRAFESIRNLKLNPKLVHTQALGESNPIRSEPKPGLVRWLKNSGANILTPREPSDPGNWVEELTGGAYRNWLAANYEFREVKCEA